MTAVATAADGNDGRDYERLLELVRERFTRTTGPLFLVEPSGKSDLWYTYLGNLPARRGHYSCSACRRFVEQFGSLVVIDESGDLIPVAWDPDEAPPFFEESVAALARRVRRGKVVGVWYTTERVLGLPRNRDRENDCVWHHLAAELPDGHRSLLPAMSGPSQKTAWSVERFRMLARGLGEFAQPTIERGTALLAQDQLYRSNRHLEQARWLLTLKKSIAKPRGKRRNHLIWRAVATAPEGWCHVRGGVLGTLLEDVQRGLSLQNIQRRWRDKLDPTQYQRPQAAPKVGAVKVAEKLVEDLGLRAAFARRFARLDEVVTLWRPEGSEPDELVQADSSEPLFAGLPTREQTDPEWITRTKQHVTWARFRRKVLPAARRIQARPCRVDSFAGLVTAQDPDAPAILQWDLPDKRNPVSLYTYSRGSRPQRWGLRELQWVDVTGVCLRPAHWYDEGAFPHQSRGAIFLLRGCREINAKGLALFPETLRSELHGVRSVIEAHSNRSKLGGYNEASACGLMIEDPSGGYPLQLRVTTGAGTADYTIDRWD
jgi:hypothetical protein